jgi:hypothetical protein
VLNVWFECRCKQLFSQVTIFTVGHNCSIPHNLNSLFTNHAVIQCHPVRATINKHNTINISQYSSNCYVNTTVIKGLYPKHALTVPDSGSQMLPMEASVQPQMVHMVLMENIVALGYVFLRMLQFSSLNIIPPIIHDLKSLHNDKIP